MKNILKTSGLLLLLLTATAMLWGCSEEDITADPELGYVELYGIPPAGEPGSYQALVRHFYDEYGTYVLHDFTEQDFRYGFTSKYSGIYTPVEEGFEEYAINMLTYIEEVLTETFGTSFLRSSLPTRIFLTKTLGTAGNITMDTRGNDYILGYIGSNQTATILNNFKSSLFESFLTNLYTNSETQPTAFFALRVVDPGKSITTYTGTWIVDPLQQFPCDRWSDGDYDYDSYYTYFLCGFINIVPVMPALYPNWTSGASPSYAKDFAEFVTFLISKPAEYIDRVMQRDDLPRLRERILTMYYYLEDVFGLDVIATQNQNQPDDPLPAGYFSQFAF